MKRVENQYLTGDAPFLSDSLLMTMMMMTMAMMTLTNYMENYVEKRKKIRISLAALLFPLTAALFDLACTDQTI